MKHKFLNLFAAGLLLFAAACSSSNSGSTGGGSLQTPHVDLAISDFNFETLNAFDAYTVLIYLDVLNNTAGDNQDPAVILDQTTSGFGDYPRVPLLTQQGDLYVGHCGSEINIWRGYATLADGATPDVTLNDDGGGAATMSCIMDLAFGNDTLFAAGEGDNAVFVYANASAIAANQVPTGILTTSVNTPSGLFYDAAADQLWVAQWTSTGTDECVLRYDGASTIAANQAPDAVLGVDPSFLALVDVGGGCRRVTVDTVNDKLFVTTNDGSSTSQEGSLIFEFDNASSFSNDDLPVAVISQLAFQSLGPSRMAVVNNRLYVSNMNFNGSGSDDCTNFAGLTGFDFDSNGDLATDQGPSVQIFGASGIQASQEVQAVGGFLFVQQFSSCDHDFNGYGDVKVYSTQSGGPLTGDTPYLNFPALKDFATASGIFAINTDLGT